MGRDPAGGSGRRSRQGPGRRGARLGRQARWHDPTMNHRGSPAVRHRSPPSGLPRLQLEVARFFNWNRSRTGISPRDRGTLIPCPSSRVIRRSLRAGGFASGEGWRDATARCRWRQTHRPLPGASAPPGHRRAPFRPGQVESKRRYASSDTLHIPARRARARKWPCGSDRPSRLWEPEWRPAADAGRDDGLPSRRGGLRVVRTAAPLRGAEFFLNSPMDSAPHSLQRPGKPRPMKSGIEIGVAGYRPVGTRLLGPSSEQIADIVSSEGDARTADLVAPTIRSIESLGRQSADRYGSVRGACRFLAEKHRQAVRSKQRKRKGRRR